jgi:hypothetical protein
MPANLNIPQVSLGKFGTVHVYKSNQSLSQGEIDACVAAYLSTMKLPYDSTIDAVSALVSVLSIAFPPFIEHFQAMASINVKEVTANKDAVLSSFGAGMTLQSDAPDRLPYTSAVNDDAFIESKTIPVFSGLSVLLFALGKNVDVNAPSPFTDGRPKALIKKHSLSVAQQAYFPNQPHGPTMKVINQLAYSFVEYPEVRGTIARLLLSQLNSENTTPPMQCILTAFKLLRGSQLAHAQAAIDCVISNPWIVNIPELRPDLKVLARDLRALNAMPEEPRWFVKLLTTDNNAIFNRQEMKKLAAVAIAWKKQKEPSFAGYKGDDTSYATLIQTFNNLLIAQKVSSIPNDNIALELGLPIMPLPEVQVNLQQPAAAV